MTHELQQAGLAPDQMLARLTSFIDQIVTFSQRIGLDLTAYQMDHIALRINDEKLAQQAHQAWLAYGDEISSAQINGRPIIVLAFNPVLDAGCWKIDCLELPYPALGKAYPAQDWEHVEFVIPSNAQTAQEYLEDLLARFPLFAVQYAQFESLGVKVKLSSPKGEGERLANPTVALKWQGITIKLHPHALKAVIESER